MNYMYPRGIPTQGTETVQQQTTEFEKNISGCGKMGQVNCSLTVPDAYIQPCFVNRKTKHLR